MKEVIRVSIAGFICALFLIFIVLSYGIEERATNIDNKNKIEKYEDRLIHYKILDSIYSNKNNVYDDITARRYKDSIIKYNVLINYLKTKK